jgi:hypothetical protein
MRIFNITVDYSYPGELVEDLTNLVTFRAGDALNEVGDEVLDEMYSELSQPGSGHVYPSRRPEGGYHMASAPGEPPAPDKGDYRDSWSKKVLTRFEEGITGLDSVATLQIMSDLWEVFGRRLELGGFGGGVYIAPRPHVRKVFESMRDRIQRLLDNM